MSSKNKNRSSRKSQAKNRTSVVVILFAAGLVVIYLLFSQYLQRPDPVASGQPGVSAEQAASTSAGDEGPEIGKRAPDFTLQDINGKTVSLSSLRGKVVMLNFWATWCPPCQAELPEIQRAYNFYRKRPDDVAMLLVDVGESRNKVNSFLKEKGYNLPVALDPPSEAANLYLVRGIPTTFFIDRDGIIRDIYIGAATEGEIRERIDALMR